MELGWGGIITYVALASSLTCYATFFLRDNMRMGWGGVITYVALASSLTCYATYTTVLLADVAPCYSALAKRHRLLLRQCCAVMQKDCSVCTKLYMEEAPFGSILALPSRILDADEK